MLFTINLEVYTSKQSLLESFKGFSSLIIIDYLLHYLCVIRGTYADDFLDFFIDCHFICV